MLRLLALLLLLPSLAFGQASMPAVNVATPAWLAVVLTATTGSIGGGVLIAGACASGTVAVTNSTTTMTVSVTPNTYPGDGVLFYGYVSTNGTVTVKVCAIIGLTPTGSTYNVRVVQ